MMPTMDAACAASMPTTSCAIGEATASKPMPQVMLTKNTHQSAPNCQVRIASAAVAPRRRFVTAPLPSGCSGALR